MAADPIPARDPNAKAAKAEPAAEKAAPKKKGSGKSGPPAPTVRNVSAWKTDAPPIIPQITVAAEHFNRLANPDHSPVSGDHILAKHHPVCSTTVATQRP